MLLGVEKLGVKNQRGRNTANWDPPDEVSCVRNPKSGAAVFVRVSVSPRGTLNPAGAALEEFKLGDTKSTRSGGWPDSRESVDAGTGNTGSPDAAANRADGRTSGANGRANDTTVRQDNASAVTSRRPRCGLGGGKCITRHPARALSGCSRR